MDDVVNPSAPTSANSDQNSAPVGEVIPQWKKNLRPFPPGRSGNPKGRPKKAVLTQELERILGKKVPEDMLSKFPEHIRETLGKRPKFASLFAYGMITAGLRGNVGAFSRVIDRVDGRVPRESANTFDEDRLDELIDAMNAPPALPGETDVADDETNGGFSETEGPSE